MLIFLIILFFIFLYSYLIEPNYIEITEHDIALKKFDSESEDFKIVHLTDIHGRKFIQGQNHLVKLVQRQKPDMIVITGDLIFKMKDFDYVLEILNKMKAPQGIYFCPGNHEYKLPLTEVIEKLEEVGVKVLRNRSTAIKLKGKDIFQLIGIDDYDEGKSFSLSKLKKGSRDHPSLLLSHSPDVVEEAVAADIDLVVSGHTHGGQICLPFFGALYTARTRHWKKYESGLYRKNSTQMYVSRGLGCSLLPLRFFCRPEIAVFYLKSPEK